MGLAETREEESGKLVVQHKRGLLCVEGPTWGRHGPISQTNINPILTVGGDRK